jgi:hypothetical protein
MNRLVLNTVDLVRTSHFDTFVGNTAVDATFIPILAPYGDKGPYLRNAAGKITKTHDDWKARTVEIDAGFYSKSVTNHDGNRLDVRSHDRKWGYEGEVVYMTRNSPLERDPAFPILALGVAFHRPSSIRGSVKRIYEGLHQAGFPAGTLTADRAYNGLSVEDFHEPLTALGHDLVFDYMVTDLGLKATYDNEKYGLIDGNWHLPFMSDYVRDYFKNAREAGKKLEDLPRDEVESILAERDTLRLIPHGRPNKDGVQRYLLPNPDGYIAYDPNTGQVLDKPKNRTVSIPLKVGLKWEQRRQFRSRTWEAWYALRPTVEHANASLKDEHNQVHAAQRRRGRGYAIQYLTFTMAVLASNVRKIEDKLARQEGIPDPKSKDRASQPVARRPRNPLKDKIAMRVLARDRRFTGLEPPELRTPKRH